MPKFVNHTPTDPDLVERIFEYLLAEFPQIAGPRLAQAKRAVRAEFQGEEVYIAGRGPSERHALAVSVMALFNGRNATEVARRLGIGRTTVYRILKQSGAKDRPAFPGNETAPGVRSVAATAIPTLPEPDSWPLPQTTLLPSMPQSPAANSASASTGET